MSELDDALALLERAVARLEAAPLHGDGEVLARLAAERAEHERQAALTAAEVMARVESALAKIGQVLDGDR